MSPICWINAPFVHVFTAEAWTKSLVVCRQQLHENSQKVSCSGLDRQEAKTFLSWKHSLPISQHPFQSYKNLWRRTSPCNPSQRKSTQARHIFGKGPALLGGPGFWHPPWLSREERINKILLGGTTMLPNGIVPFPIRVVFPISICCILQSPFVGKHIHGSLQGCQGHSPATLRLKLCMKSNMPCKDALVSICALPRCTDSQQLEAACTAVLPQVPHPEQSREVGNRPRLLGSLYGGSTFDNIVTGTCLWLWDSLRL